MRLRDLGRFCRTWPRRDPAPKTSASGTAWAIVFTIDPSDDVTFRLRDEHGRPTIASLLITDAAGRVYPARSKRLAPDFFFQPHI